VPAETNRLRDPADARMVLDLVSSVLGVNNADAAHLALVDLELDDFSIVHLWAAVVEEFGESPFGELEPEGSWPTTLGELAAVFTRSLRR
jgi:hypothetical protein